MGRWGAFDQDGGRCGNFERITEPSLVLHIFSFLDLAEMFRLRAVCRSWYDAVLSARFIELYKPPLEPWGVLRVRTGQPVDWELRYDEDHFDYGMKLENHTELWRPHSFQRKRCNLPLGPSGSHFVGLCSSNGLVCGMLMEHKDSLTLAVGNPITNTWKALPPAPIASSDRPRPAYLNISMETETNANSSSYQIVILYQKNQTPVEGPTQDDDDDDDQVFSLQYESDLCSWQEGPFFSTSNSLGSPLRGCAFFYIGENVFPAYDPHSRAWSHVAISRPARNEQGHEQEQEDDSWENWSSGYIGTFMYKGKCYWATLMFNAETFEDIGVAIWEMKQESSTWVLVSRALSKDLFGPNCCLTVGDKDMTVNLVKDTAFISSFYRKESHGVWPPIAYDFALSKWYTCSGMENEDIECSYVVLPSLAAKP